MPHPFLTVAWLAEVKSIRDSMGEMPTPAGLSELKLNLTVTGSPEGDKEMHLDASGSGLQIQPGHLGDAPTSVTLPYDTAKAMFVDGDQQAAMQAFMSGQIRVQGDMTRLMALQSIGAPSPEQQAFQQKVKDVTA